MNTNKLTFAALAAMAVALSVALLVSSVAIPIEAKISCQTKGGNEPPGQQDGKQDCHGNKVRANPAGHQPPGQQP
jgi:hypothetical protein